MRTDSSEDLEVKTSFIDRMPLCLAVFALVFFSRTWLIKTWGSPVPFWDEWDAEGLELYRSFLRGNLHLADLFAAHNEHRVFFTRLADLALFTFSGGWNVWNELLLNAVLHAATAGWLVAFFSPALRAPGRIGFALGIVVLFSATFGWQNALWGFQSQVYFADLFSLIAIIALTTKAPFTIGWWLGGMASVFSIFSNGGGVLSMVSLAIALVQFSLVEGAWFHTRYTLIFTGVIIFFGAFFSVTPAQHLLYHAHSYQQFSTVFGKCLAWPLQENAWFLIITQGPVVALFLWRMKSRTPFTPAERCALALGWLAVCHSAAIAYSRGAALVDSKPISRYLDPLALGAAAQLFAGLHLAQITGKAGRIGAVIWAASIAFGLLTITETNLTLHLPYKRRQDHASLAIVREYFVSKNPDVFTHDPAFKGPHPDSHSVIQVIDDPFLRAVLPEAIRNPNSSPEVGRPLIVQYSEGGTIFAFFAFLIISLFLLRAPEKK